MRVLKFGGTSVATVESFTTVVSIVEQNAREDQIAVVLSALGGITDLLVEACDASRGGKFDTAGFRQLLRDRHAAMLAPLAQPSFAIDAMKEIDHWLEELARRLHGIALLEECSPRTRDAVLALGERLSLPLLVATLRSKGHQAAGVDATSFIRTNGDFGRAEVNFEESRILAQPIFGRLPVGTIPVISGFIGSDANGTITTLGRSGSDYTASILGNLLSADLVEIWTDTDGVMSADPRIIHEAVPLPAITYREAADLSLLGAKVIHPRTVQPLEMKGIPLRIRNTFRPNAPGTLITKGSVGAARGVKSLTTLTGTALISVRCGTGISTTGLYHRLFSVLDKLNVAVLTVSPSLSEGAISFLTADRRVGEITAALESDLRKVFRGHEFSIETRDELSIVTAVGDGIQNSSTVGRTFLETLEQKRVPPLAMAQGVSDVSLSAVVEKTHERKALRALHTAFIQHRHRIGLVLAGPTGNVGRALVQLVGLQHRRLAEDYLLDFQLLGGINRKRMVWDEGGIPAREFLQVLSGGESADWTTCLDRLRAYRGTPLLFIDCTASPFIARQYVTLLEADIAVVTPNKIANTLEYSYYQTLHRLGRQKGHRYLYETTVGAATPMLQALEDLRATGDRIQRLEGVLSGTLSFVFDWINKGGTFSDAVREAASRGFTEPHPATDLSGEDVARKLLILAREAGYRLEREDITVNGLVPAEFRPADDPAEYLRQLVSVDAYWAGLSSQAHARGNRLTYLASFDGSEAQVGFKEVPVDSPFVHLRPSENAVHYYSDRHTPLPLTIQGIGAGREATARGILADVIHAATEMAA